MVARTKKSYMVDLPFSCPSFFLSLVGFFLDVAFSSSSSSSHHCRISGGKKGKRKQQKLEEERIKRWEKFAFSGKKVFGFMKVFSLAKVVGSLLLSLFSDSFFLAWHISDAAGKKREEKLFLTAIFS